MGLGRAMLGIGGVALAGFGLVVKSAAEFEQVMSKVRAVMAPTEAQYDALVAKALLLGQESVFSAQKVAEGFNSMAKAGLSAEEILEGAADAAVALTAAAEGIGLDRGAEILANAMRTFGAEASELPHFADVLAGAANKSTLEIEDLATSLRYVGPLARENGISFQEFNTALAILGDRGIKGSTAGTSLRGILVSLNPVSDKATAKMRELGIMTDELGNRFFHANGEAKSLADVSQILQEATAGLSQEEKIAAFNILFRRRAMASALVLADQGAEGFKAYSDAIGEISAADVASEKLNNLAGDITILKSNIETLLITAGTPFQEQLREWIQLLTELVQSFAALDEEMQTTIVKTLGLVGVTFTLLGIFNLLVGTLLRFGYNVAIAGRFLGQLAWFFTGPIVKGIIAFVGALVWAFGAVAVAVAALVVAIVAGLVLAYFHIQGFRDFVDGVLGAIGRFFLRLRDDVVETFRDIKQWIQDAPENFQKMKDEAGRTLDDFLAIVGRFVGGVIEWFQLLPGRVLPIVGEFLRGVGSWFAQLPGILHNAATVAVEGFLSFMAQLPYRVGFILGFVIGRLVQWGILLVFTIWEFGPKIVSALVNGLISLNEKVGEIFDKVREAIVRILWAILTKIVEWGGVLIESIITFFRELPSRIAGFLSLVATKMIEFFLGLVALGIEYGPKVIEGIISFFRDLPENIARLLSFVISRMVTFGIEAVRKGKEIAGKIKDGIVDGIKALPGLVKDILGNIIQAIKDKITDAFNVVRNFARGMWDGFKEGLGMNSPTLIEKAMVSMTENVDTELSKFRRQVKEVQGLGRGLPNLNDSLTTASGAGVLRPFSGADAIAAAQVPTTSTTTFHVDQVVAQDPMAVMRETERRARLASLVNAPTQGGS